MSACLRVQCAIVAWKKKIFTGLLLIRQALNTEKNPTATHIFPSRETDKTKKKSFFHGGKGKVTNSPSHTQRKEEKKISSRVSLKKICPPPDLVV